MSQPAFASSEPRSINIISAPMSVQMADEWYDIADLNHFWIRRRFDVCRKLLRDANPASLQIGEIGCGNGLVQRQFEDQWQVAVDGFDLNRPALERSISRRSQLFYYDVHEKRTEFEERYDLILLFDVLEHIQDDEGFLQSVCFHLKKDGAVLINVPAIQRLYSPYDVAAGHVRRYDSAGLNDLARRCQLRIQRWTYWGLPLYPLLMIRQRMLRKTPASQVIALGFSPRNALANSALRLLAAAETIPQHLLGTSLMALLTR